MAEKLGNWKRTGMCQEFSEKDIGKSVTLMGWVNSRRNLGGLIFVWLRDRSGVIQLVFDEAEKKSYFADAQSLRSEYVIAVKGQIAARAPENYNDDLATGRIEVRVEELKILSEAQTPPFEMPRPHRPGIAATVQNAAGIPSRGTLSSSGRPLRSPGTLALCSPAGAEDCAPAYRDRLGRVLLFYPDSIV